MLPAASSAQELRQIELKETMAGLRKQVLDIISEKKERSKAGGGEGADTQHLSHDEKLSIDFLESVIQSAGSGDGLDLETSQVATPHQLNQSNWSLGWSGAQPRPQPPRQYAQLTQHTSQASQSSSSDDDDDDDDDGQADPPDPAPDPQPPSQLSAQPSALLRKGMYVPDHHVTIIRAAYQGGHHQGVPNPPPGEAGSTPQRSLVSTIGVVHRPVLEEADDRQRAPSPPFTSWGRRLVSDEEEEDGSGHIDIDPAAEGPSSSGRPDSVLMVEREDDDGVMAAVLSAGGEGEPAVAGGRGGAGGSSGQGTAHFMGLESDSELDDATRAAIEEINKALMDFSLDDTPPGNQPGNQAPPPEISNIDDVVIEPPLVEGADQPHSNHLVEGADQPPVEGADQPPVEGGNRAQLRHVEAPHQGLFTTSTHITLRSASGDHGGDPHPHSPTQNTPLLKGTPQITMTASGGPVAVVGHPPQDSTHALFTEEEGVKRLEEIIASQSSRVPNGHAPPPAPPPSSASVTVAPPSSAWVTVAAASLPHQRTLSKDSGDSALPPSPRQHHSSILDLIRRDLEQFRLQGDCGTCSTVDSGFGKN